MKKLFLNRSIMILAILLISSLISGNQPWNTGGALILYLICVTYMKEEVKKS
ncbi:MAG: hypothetical protein LBV67_03570 [Streptococcaceae bacterium]|jgi:hypothetical protein|nr:hypothetical protein [Streptococcaceae bacterium]